MAVVAASSVVTDTEDAFYRTVRCPSQVMHQYT